MLDFPYIHEALRFLAVPVASLNEDPDNTRLHPEESVEAIVESFNRFGQDEPVVVQRKGMVVRKGNGRLMAAKRLGWTHVAALIVDDDDLNAVARSIADNRSSELSEWDTGKLAQALRALDKSKAVDLAAIGFSANRIADLESRVYRQEKMAEIAADDEGPREESPFRTVQLFFTEEGLAEFQEKMAALRDRFDCKSIAETVVRTIDEAVKL